MCTLKWLHDGFKKARKKSHDGKVEVEKIPRRMTKLNKAHAKYLVAQMVKRLPAMQGTPRLGRSPGEGNGNPLQYSCLENFVDRGAW